MNTEIPAANLLPLTIEGGGASVLARGLLGGAALSLVAGIAEHKASRRRWPSTSPSFTIYPAEQGAAPEALIYVETGFNSPPGPPAGALLPLLTQYATVAVVRGSDAGFDIDKHTQAIRDLRQQTNAKVVIPFGLSMGGTQNLPVAASLRRDDGIEVFPVLGSSPIHREDIRGTARQRSLGTLAFIHDRLRLRGGVAARILLETIGYAIDNANDRIGLQQAVGHALSKIRQEDTPSNAQCLSRAAWFCGYDATADLIALSDSPIGYMGPADPTRDPVVDNDLAVARIPGPVIRASHPDVGHANPCDYPVEHQAMAAHLLEQFGLRSAAERRATIFSLESILYKMNAKALPLLSKYVIIHLLQGANNMSMDQVRAQRAYLEAADLRREADQKIIEIEGELERWRRIRDNAIALGDTALTDTSGDSAP